MTSFQKLRLKFSIYFSMKLNAYSKKADCFLHNLITKGKFLYADRYEAYIEYNGKVYAVWISNTYYASCASAHLCTKFHDGLYVYYERIYSYVRPSRYMEYKFFLWLYENQDAQIERELIC